MAEGRRKPRERGKLGLLARIRIRPTHTTWLARRLGLPPRRRGAFPSELNNRHLALEGEARTVQARTVQADSG